jgi:hypothetical protein
MAFMSYLERAILPTTGQQVTSEVLMAARPVTIGAPPSGDGQKLIGYVIDPAAIRSEKLQELPVPLEAP